MANPQVTTAAVVSAEEHTIRVNFDQTMRQDALFYDVANWSVDSHTIVAVSSKLGVSTALLYLGEEMLTNAYLSVRAYNVTNEAAEVVDGAFNTAYFVAQGVAPDLVSASASSPTSILVTFSEPMRVPGRDDPSNYFVLAPIGASEGTIGNVQIDSPTQCTLNLNYELTTGAQYTLLILVSQFLDLAGNPITSTGNYKAVYFAGVGSAPQMVSAVLEDNGKLTVTFNEDMCDEGALVAKQNYIVEPTAPGAAPVFVKSVKRINARTVSLEISETTAGAGYVVGADGVRDAAKNEIDPANADANFVGAGDSPRVAMVRAIGPNRVDVIFSEEMLDNDEIRDPSRYSFTGGLTVLSATPDPSDARVVALVTTPWIPNTEYTLTITP